MFLSKGMVCKDQSVKVHTAFLISNISQPTISEEKTSFLTKEVMHTDEGKTMCGGKERSNEAMMSYLSLVQTLCL